MKNNEQQIKEDKELLNKNNKIISIIKPIEEKLNVNKKDYDYLIKELKTIDSKILEASSYEKEIDNKKQTIKQIKTTHEK